MGKKASNVKRFESGSGHGSITLRDQSTGIKNKAEKSVSKMLKFEHLKNLASWAGGEASIPPLAALYGFHLSCVAEEIGLPIDTSIFLCQRCETHLRPGYNCTVRVEKNKTKKGKLHETSYTSARNNIVYTCHFCSYNNMKHGPPRDHLKQISSKAENASVLKPNKFGENPVYAEKEKFQAMKPTMIEDSPLGKSSGTSMEKTPILLSRKKRQHSETSDQGLDYGAGSSNKRVGINVGSAMAEAVKGTSRSSKRKRKGWITLKETAEREAHQNATNIANLTIPFLI